VKHLTATSVQKERQSEPPQTPHATTDAVHLTDAKCQGLNKLFRDSKSQSHRKRAHLLQGPHKFLTPKIAPHIIAPPLRSCLEPPCHHLPACRDDLSGVAFYRAEASAKADGEGGSFSVGWLHGRYPRRVCPQTPAPQKTRTLQGLSP